MHANIILQSLSLISKTILLPSPPSLPPYPPPSLPPSLPPYLIGPGCPFEVSIIPSLALGPGSLTGGGQSGEQGRGGGRGGGGGGRGGGRRAVVRGREGGREGRLDLAFDKLLSAPSLPPSLPPSCTDTHPSVSVRAVSGRLILCGAADKGARDAKGLTNAYEGRGGREGGREGMSMPQSANKSPQH